VDVATDAVIGELSRRNVPFLRINTEDYPFSGRFDYRPGSPGQHLFSELIGAADFRSIWYRRVRVPARPEGMDLGVYEFCVRESRNALLGGILGRSCRWMSRADAIWKAEFKPFQLEVAANLGLSVPNTLISNVPDSVRAFLDSCHGQMIAKPVRSGHIVQNGVDYAVYTTKVGPEDVEDLQDASLSPTIYQELVPKRFDIRVTVVGRKIFAAAIDSQTDPDASVDWRRTSNPKLPHYAVSLPSDLESTILALMDAMTLQYGAIDFVLAPDGRYVFLEINPNGQWLWLDDMLSLGISAEIAEWLARESD
jgi:glutathione synthase/RimK-type ligase-like ATP-grasp enzyme